MNGRQRFLNAFTDTAPDRPPAWIMRQAGRYLPEYRALKERYDFLTLVQTPELATEVTLQPLHRYPVLDAAIIFSDILVIPEAMGQPYHFHPEGGIRMEFAIRDRQQVRRLTPEAVPEKTAYQPAALRMVHRELNGSKALLGFAGSPFTLATYMLEGGSSRSFAHTRRLLAEDPKLFDELLETITRAVIHLVQAQIEAGVDAVQIFDSWAGAVPAADYESCSLRWIRRIIDALPDDFPVILFAKGRGDCPSALAGSFARALAADYSVDLARWRRQLPLDLTVQGNLDPHWMTQSPGEAVAAATGLLRSMYPWNRYIFNLGHGITPQARTETVAAVLETLASAPGS